MTFVSPHTTGARARLFARAALLAVCSLTSLAARVPIGSVRDLASKQQAICVRRADTVQSNSRPSLPSKFQSSLAAGRSQKGVSAAPAAAAAQYTLSQLSAMSYTDMVNTLVGLTSWEDVTDLWTYSSSARTFYGDTYRVQAIMDAISSRGSSFTATDNKGIPTLGEVLRAGFYHGWYHPTELPAMNDRNTHNKALPAIRSCQANPYFSLNYAAGCDVISATGLIIANGSCDPGIVRGYQNILSQFNTNFDTYAGDFAKGTAWFNVCNGIDYDLYELRNNGQIDPVTLTEWYGQINYFLDEIFKTAGKPVSSYTTNNAWAIDGAIYYSARAGKFHSTQNRALQVISDAMNTYGKNPWKYASAQAAQMIHFDYNNVDYYGNTLNWTQIQNEIRQQYLPQTRTFDGGLFEARYGNAVSLEKMKTLIWAHKETKAQFFRTLGADTPADPKQTSDNRLQIIVYNTPDEYRMNGVAYGLDTNNGGMYIEGDGTFYTYERTTQESIYSLEELFRHEGVHYLQGRFMVPGGWGASPIYDGNRLTWFEEGGAEWHAGATRAAGIKSRPTKTMYIPSDLSARMTISTLIHTGYGGWSFYDYGCNLFDYLYNNGRQDTHLNMMSAIRVGNTATFDSLATGLTSYESAYQSYLTTLLANSGTFPDPSTSPDYLATHPYKTLASVQSEITAATGLTGVTVATTKGTDWSTFTLRGTYTGSASAGLLPDWNAMSARTDGWLNTMTASAWSGYKTLTAYFVNYRKDASNRVQYDVVFHGVCTDTAVSNNQDPRAVITAPATGTPNKPTAFSGSGSSDPDGTIVSYSWTFGDNTTATGASVSKTYTKPGTYPVTLTVTDNFGATNTATISHRQEYTDPIGAEWEPNNTAADACGPVGGGVNVTGSVAPGDDKDYFFINATSAGTIVINMAFSGTVTSTWQLFHESDLSTYVAYMSDPTITYTVPANKLGRYYLMVYTFGAGNTYNFNVSGTALGTNVPTLPVISTQPSGVSVTAGSTATFNVAASGTGLSYQWQKQTSSTAAFTAISGATAASYTTPATTTADNGAGFRVVVTNTAGSVTSSTAALTVTTVPTAPVITTQPANRSVTAGSTATFSVVASGSGLSYQWQKQISSTAAFTAISGATAASYTTPATTTSDNGAGFRVVVSNSAGSVTSNTATLAVTGTTTETVPTISTPPAGLTVSAGSTASFSVVAAGGNLTYQWARRAPGATTYVNITGATASSYTTPATTTADNNAAFRVRVTNTKGTVTSTGAVLKVTGSTPTAPVITTQPANRSVAAGSTAAFSVVASGTSLTYQWRKNGANISGATAASYTTPATTTSDNGATFSVVVSNSAGSVTSNNATLTVTGGGADTTAPTVNLVITAAAGTATCNPNAADNVGVTKVTYWVDSNAAVDVTASPFTLVVNTASMTAGSTHQVYCRAYDAAGNSVDSGWKSFTVVGGGGGADTTAPTVSVSATVGTGGSVTYNATASDNTGVAQVIFYTDSWSAFTTDTAAPWSGSRTGLTSGTHYVLAEARDAAGNVGYTSWISFVIP